ncbi:hypothetical protein AVEN_132628-1 [Araneus ventricosus]|uniref:Uncharacterized protein n=1 Tax=Araneus ventricosus TaxID=182803 RepID=A0A4Y2AUI0_ARAVE|nr:hypothetical protein AVEN_132628-1 [Araneus ventricosus]
MLRNLSLNEWQQDWDSGDTERAIFNILPKVTLTPASWSRESILFATVHGPFSRNLYRFRLHHSDICAYGEKGDPLHYATSCHMTLSYHFTKPSAEDTQLWRKSVLSNKLSRINIAKLVSFLTENENLIKQPPDATSSSDSDPDLSPSPRPQTYGLRPSRGSKPSTLISPPTITLRNIAQDELVSFALWSDPVGDFDLLNPSVVTCSSPAEVIIGTVAQDMTFVFTAPKINNDSLIFS